MSMGELGMPSQHHTRSEDFISNNNNNNNNNIDIHNNDNSASCSSDNANNNKKYLCDRSELQHFAIYGDGSCLYRAIACAMNPTLLSLQRNEFGIIVSKADRPKETEAAVTLREPAAEYIDRHWDDFPSVPLDERREYLKGVRGTVYG